ncbi:MAG: DUF4097 family beta strand repeat protein [Pyrinomonadaceae bacterium]|nr:DUF4097 family beta strand repeat protein [Pyrinomonadaceae bacterium]
MYWIISVLVAILISISTASGMTDKPNVKAGLGETDSDSHKSLSRDETERFEQVYNLNPDGSVKAANISGNIRVSTWESPQVRLVAVKTAENAEILKDMELKIESTQESFYVKVKYRDRDRDNDEYRNYKNYGSVEFELTVPRTAKLTGISSVSGDITIDGTDNYTKASSVSGDVKGMNLGGTAKLSSVSGIVEADFSNVAAGSDIKLSSVSGGVILKLPSYAGASVKASTVSGKITNDFGLKVDEGKYVGASMKGSFGDGSVAVRMSTVSGRINVAKQ